MLLRDTVLPEVLPVRVFYWQTPCYQECYQSETVIDRYSVISHRVCLADTVLSGRVLLADTVLLELLPVKRQTCDLITCMTDLRTCLVIG